MTETEFDPNRKLCPDGSCVGIIDDAGRCSLCGQIEGTEPKDGRSIAESSEMSEVVPGFDATRRLCDDGSCVGLVGADGVCGTCGRKAE